MVEQSLIQQIKDKYDKAVDGWQIIYEKARDDLLFLSDEPGAQWDEKLFNDRKKLNRPCLTMDQTNQFVKQVTNDIRQNTPAIKLLPNGDGADIETAEMLQGLIRHIEYDSDADEVYDTAADFAVKSSIGFIRVDHEYADDDSFDQKLCIKRVVDPSLIYIDPNSIEADGSDMKYAFVLEQIHKEDFKKRFPEKALVSFPVTGEHNDQEDHIWIAEYYEVEEREETISIGSREFGDYRERKITKRSVTRRLVSGQEDLEDAKEFPGTYVPIVPVYGDEQWYDGKRHLVSLIRPAKDEQRAFNLWKSLEMELVMKQPQAPVMVAARSIAGFEDQWRDPGKSFALTYNATDEKGQPLPPPTRLEPPVVPTGVVNAARSVIDDMKSTLGMHNASVGEIGNEISGIAINERKKEGDVATFHFMDNLRRSIAQVGKILVGAIPSIYDTPRVLRIIGEEDDIQEVTINAMEMAEGQERPYDLTRGKYSVKVVSGASFTTKRQEEAQFLTEVVTANPELLGKIGDLLFESMDFPKSQAIAARFKKLIDPALLDEEMDAQTAALQQQLMEAQGVNEQLQAALAEMQQRLDDKEAELVVKAADNEAQNETDRLKLLLQEQELQSKERLELAKLELEAKRYDLELAKFTTLQQGGNGGVSLPIEQQ